MIPWLRQLPQIVRVVALGTILLALVTFYAYERGKAAGELDARLAADRQAVAAAVVVRDTAGVHATQAVAVAAKARAALVPVHDAARIVDSTHVAISTIPPNAVEKTVARDSIVVVPPEVVRRMVADSLVILKQGAAIDSLGALARADSSVIQSQAKEIGDLQSATAPRCGWKCGAVLGVSAVALVRVALSFATRAGP